MIKNIILDIGGIILDDSKENLRKYLQVSKEETEKLYKIVYGSKGFRQYLLGYINLEECMNLVISENQEYFFDSNSYYLNYKGHRYISEQIQSFL